jgi:hypothetical protein
VKWFFDMEYGGCSRFWYGGCEGNDNRFSSQEECKERCVEPPGRGKFHVLLPNSKFVKQKNTLTVSFTVFKVSLSYVFCNFFNTKIYNWTTYLKFTGTSD